MARITKADLEQLVKIIATHTGDDGYFIEYTSGRPRLYRDERGGHLREVSPRLSISELVAWLEGFIDGIDAGKRSEEGLDDDE